MGGRGAPGKTPTHFYHPQKGGLGVSTTYHSLPPPFIIYPSVLYTSKWWMGEEEGGTSRMEGSGAKRVENTPTHQPPILSLNFPSPSLFLLFLSLSFLLPPVEYASREFLKFFFGKRFPSISTHGGRLCGNFSNAPALCTQCRGAI